MTLILSNDDVAKVLTIGECIDALEEAYIELAEGRGVTRTRSDTMTPTARPDALYSLKSMDGVIPKFGISAVRINSDILTWPTDGNTMRRVKVPAAPGNRYVGLVLLFSTATGEPLAILPDGVMQRLRVGAANGIALKHLAREDASVIGLLGSGWQAGAQLMAACAVRKIERVRCFSPSRDNREAFARTMTEALGIDVSPVEQPEEAIAGADVAMCATNAIDPVFYARWIEPGMCLSSIKRPEIEAAGVLKADRVVIHARESAPIFTATTGLKVEEQSDNRGWNSAGAVDFKTLPTLPELLIGKVAGRQSDDEVTCFINNLGIGYQFAAAGAVVYRKAKESGLGRELPTDWFTEDVHP
jgi:alanine dehydrogenase